MQDDATKEPSKLAIFKLAIPLLIALISLLIYNFNSINNYQKMAEDIRQSMFQDPSISALLLTYRDNQNIKELTVNVKGISGDLAAYRVDVIKFVCNSDFLSGVLASSDSVDVKLSASLRKQDKYLHVSVTPELCLGLN
jgi:hypothetical protein